MYSPAIPIILATLASSPDPSTTSAGSHEEIRAIVDEALADARSRSSLTDASARLTSSGRFVLSTTNDAYSLSPSAEFIFRYQATFGANEDRAGFDINRLRLHMRGHVITPKLTYRVHASYRQNSGDFRLEDAYAQYDFDSGDSVRTGQFRLPFDRENATSRTLTLGVNRSLLSTVFGPSRSTGFQFKHQENRWRITSALSNGRRNTNSSFDARRNADIAISNRFERRFADASWRQYRDQSAFPGDDFGALLGIGLHWEQGDDLVTAQGAQGHTNLLVYTADLGFEGDGWNLLAAFSGQTIDSNNPTYTDLGFLVQGGYFIDQHIELYARYTHIFPDPDRPDGDDFPAITAGSHWYVLPQTHVLRISAEVTYYPNPQQDSASLIRAPNTSQGILRDDSGGQLALILQFQLLF